MGQPHYTNWPDLLTALLENTDLQAADTNWAMNQIMEGSATPAQISAFAVALRAKGETAKEVEGLVEAMFTHAQTLEVEGPTLDIVGTGGDLAHTVNISTMSSIVAASAGARVVKHGNRAASSQCGSADVLEYLGVSIEQQPDQVLKSVDNLGIGFCFAPIFHPAYRHAGPPRREIGIPTVFNILGPLANPSRPTAQMVGCANQRLAPLMAQVLADRGTRALVVRGMDGLDEVTVFDATEVWDATEGRDVAHTALDLEGTGIERAEPGALRGGDAAFNAAVVRDIFAGQTEGNLGAIRDAVALNTAASLVTWDAANDVASEGGVTARISAALPRAYEAIDSGAAGDLLDRWIAASS